MSLFSVTLFLSAALSFVVQPLVAKRLLPYLGGSPSVWNTSLVFFQATLLGGYGLAHYFARYKSRAQVIAQLALLALAAAAGLRFAFMPLEPPAAATAPTAWLLGALAATVGLPFLALCVNSTLLQRWFAVTQPGRNPYVLYRSSNLGSLLGLIAYPFALEPLLTGRQQALLWASGLTICFVLVAACARRVWSSAGAPAGTPSSPDAAAPGAGRRFAWLVLAFIPSSLTIGVTTHLTTDLAAIPMLWVIPLALYLLSFAIAFGPRADRAMAAAAWAFPVLIVFAIGSLLVSPRLASTAGIVVHPLLLFVVGLLAHGQLAASRPDARHLTGFYLLVALGGVLGGAFNALVAPHVFSTVAEYPLVLLLAAFVIPAAVYGGRTSLLDAPLALAVGASTIAAGWLAGRLWPDSAGAVFAVFLAPALLALLVRKHWLRAGTAAVAVYLAGMYVFAGPSTLVLAQVRTFFGVLRVTSEQGGRFHVLRHGTTSHGRQDRRGGLRRIPLSYFHPQSPIGQVFAMLRKQDRPLKVGVVGLGTGTMAAYARAGDEWVFYEIDEAVVKIAQTGAWFSYLSDAPVTPRTVLGDARVSLTREPPQGFDVLVLDAFTSDAIPVHLLTQEAFELYRRHLSPTGLVASHVSNRHLDLPPVIVRVAAAASLQSVHQTVIVNREAAASGLASSRWVVSGSPQAMASIDLEGARWVRERLEPGLRPWTDDYSNLAGVMVWRR